MDASEQRLHQLFLLNLCLQIFDGVATYHGLRFWGEGNPLVAGAIPYLGLAGTLCLFKAKACGFLVLLRRLGPRPFVRQSMVLLATVYGFFSFLPWMARPLFLVLACAAHGGARCLGTRAKHAAVASRGGSRSYGSRSASSPPATCRRRATSSASSGAGCGRGSPVASDRRAAAGSTSAGRSGRPSRWAACPRARASAPAAPDVRTSWRFAISRAPSQRRASCSSG